MVEWTLGCFEGGSKVLQPLASRDDGILAGWRGRTAGRGNAADAVPLIIDLLPLQTRPSTPSRPQAGFSRNPNLPQPICSRAFVMMR